MKNYLYFLSYKKRTFNLYYLSILNTFVGLGLTCLTTYHEVAGSIPGTSTNFRCGLGLERAPLSLARTIG